MTENYSVKNIKSFEGVAAVRLRPQMYIGGTNENGIIHLCKEIIDNSCDEFLAGYAKNITVEVFEKTQKIRISDDGRGIPVCDDKSKIAKIKELSKSENTVEKIFCKLHSGGKFSNDDGYKLSAGLNGVGACCTNALSSECIVTVHRDGYEWKQSFKEGKPTTNLVKGSKVKSTGTIVEFTPDQKIFTGYNINIDMLHHNIKNRAYLNSGLSMVFKVFESEKSSSIKLSKTYKFKNGIVDYLNDLNKTPITPPVYIDGSEIVSKNDGTKNEIHYNISFNYGKEEGEHCHTFVNSIQTSEGGTHLKAFRMAISECIKKYIDQNNILNKQERNLEITGEDIRENLYAIISLKHSNPQYESQTKIKLSNTDVEGPIRKAINSKFSKFLLENPEISALICKNVILTVKSRKAARAAKDKILKKANTNFLSLSNVSKLADCINKDNETTELFVVEGLSAAGPAKEARDKYTQAIYSIRGKPLNVCDINVMDIVGSNSSRDNKEIEDIVNIWGGNGIGKNYDDAARKYSRFVILADSDLDGLHIQSLLSTLIFKNYKGLVENNRLFIAMPPLYRIQENGKYKYLLDDYEYELYILSRMKKLFDDKYSIKDLRNTYKIYNSINNLSIKINIPLILLQSINKCKDKKEVVNLIKSKFKSLHIIKREKIYICNGFLDEEYINFIINKKLINKLSDINSLFKKSETKIDLIEFESILKKSTPKHRTRMKGLGKPIAPYRSNSI